MEITKSNDMKNNRYNIQIVKFEGNVKKIN